MPSDFFLTVLPGFACHLPADFCQLQMASVERSVEKVIVFAGVLTFCSAALVTLLYQIAVNVAVWRTSRQPSAPCDTMEWRCGGIECHSTSGTILA